MGCKPCFNIDDPSGVSSQVIAVTRPPRPPRLRVPSASRDGVAMERSLGAILPSCAAAIKWDHPGRVIRSA